MSLYQTYLFDNLIQKRKIGNKCIRFLIYDILQTPNVFGRFNDVVIDEFSFLSVIMYFISHHGVFSCGLFYPFSETTSLS